MKIFQIQIKRTWGFLLMMTLVWLPASCSLDTSALSGDIFAEIRQDRAELVLPKGGQVNFQDGDFVKVEYKLDDDSNRIPDLYSELTVRYVYSNHVFSLTFKENDHGFIPEMERYQYYWTVYQDREYYIKVDRWERFFLVPYIDDPGLRLRPSKIVIEFLR